MPNPKHPYQKKLRWSKKGGVSVFLLKVKKTVFLCPPPLRGGNRLHSQVPSECDNLQRTRVYGDYFAHHYLLPPPPPPSIDRNPSISLACISLGLLYQHLVNAKFEMVYKYCDLNRPSLTLSLSLFLASIALKGDFHLLALQVL